MEGANVQKMFSAGRRILQVWNVWEKIWPEEEIATAGCYTSSANFTKPDGVRKITVFVVGAGGHGGAGGGMTMWGGRGGVGGLVTKTYEGEELENLPETVGVVVGICPNATGATGGNSSFNADVIAYGGGGGGNGGFGYNGANGYNGSGTGGNVTVGAPASDRTFEGIVYGQGGSGTQGGGGGYAGMQGCVYIEWEF